jgi:hypothetical protein
MQRAVAILMFQSLTQDSSGTVFVSEYGTEKEKLKRPEWYSYEAIWQPLKQQKPQLNLYNENYSLDKLFAKMSMSTDKVVYMDSVRLFKDTRNINCYRDYGPLDCILGLNRPNSKTIITWGHSDYNTGRYAQRPLQSILDRSRSSYYVYYDEKADELGFWGWKGVGKRGLLFTMKFEGPLSGQIQPYVEPIFDVNIQNPGYFTTGDLVDCNEGSWTKLMRIDAITKYYEKSSRNVKIKSVSVEDVKNELKNPSSLNYSFRVELSKPIDDGSCRLMPLSHLLSPEDKKV